MKRFIHLRVLQLDMSPWNLCEALMDQDTDPILSCQNYDQK